MASVYTQWHNLTNENRFNPKKSKHYAIVALKLEEACCWPLRTTIKRVLVPSRALVKLKTTPLGLRCQQLVKKHSVSPCQL